MKLQAEFGECPVFRFGTPLSFILMLFEFTIVNSYRKV